MAAAVVLMFFAGRWVDGKLGTYPWCMLAGILLGAVGGLVTFLRAVSEVSDSEKAEKKK
jgi:ATP synthase protein I